LDFSRHQLHLATSNALTTQLHRLPAPAIMAEIKIDTRLFQERISHIATAWKNDIRLKEGVFNGVSSMLIMMGKVEDAPEYHKNNAMHVSHHPNLSPAGSIQSSLYISCQQLNHLIVLAPWLRVPDDPDAPHSRYNLYFDYPKERWQTHLRIFRNIFS
jgi:hypothetical protein